MGLGIGPIIKLGRDLIKFLVKNKKYWKKYWWVLLLLAIAVQAKQNHTLKAKLQEAQGGGLELKENEIAKVKIGSGSVASATRDGKGGVNQKKDFKAPEAKVDVIVKKDPEIQKQIDALNKALADAKAKGEEGVDEVERLEAEKKALEAKLFQVDVKVQKWGFVFKPGFGIVFDGDMHPEVDIKFLFWNRYSLKAGSTVSKNPLFTAGLTRHIDDLIPRPFNFQNLEIQILFGSRFESFLKDKRLVVGARINL